MRILPTILLFLIPLLVIGQDQIPAYSKVSISLENSDLNALAQLGINLEDGEYHKAHSFTGYLTAYDIALIEAEGFSYSILVEDMAAFYMDQQQNGMQSLTAADCNVAESKWVIPENFELGSLGGFYSYDEMLAELDDMAAAYPDLITVRAPASDTILTHQGREIFYVKISDNPNIDESEPEVLYNAMHHAREPGSMMHLIYYMWYLLEQYQVDPTVEYLVNSTELYFIPCVNPDGYILNETENPTGGGFWRKNCRDINGDGQITIGDGVDLNRNYGYEWGYDDNGSSPDPSSAVYRGESPFSEPETRTVRDFCNEHEFVFAHNNHTSGDLLIYPWSWNNELADPAFAEYSNILILENNYFAGTTIETVGYNVNGDANDWMWGETLTKPPIFTFIPETGSGFWPNQDNIIGYCQDMMWHNLTTAYLTLNYGHFTYEVNDLTVLNNTVDYNLKRYGLADGSLTVSMTPLSNNIVTTSGTSTVYSLDQFEEIDDVFIFDLAVGTEEGDEVIYVLSLDNGQYTHHDTISLFFGSQILEEILTDAGDDLSNWDNQGNNPNNNWQVTIEDFVSAPTSITDSPSAEYIDNLDQQLLLNTPVSLIDATTAYLRFSAKWDIEPDYDYVQVEASTDGISFIPLCGNYTNTGVPNQNAAEGEPLYDGFVQEWVEEEMDLSDYLGNDLYIRFQLVSDGGVTEDGFYFDDLSVVVAIEEMVNTTYLSSDDFEVFQNIPNPANDFTIISYPTSSEQLSSLSLTIINSLGQTISHMKVPQAADRYKLKTSNWPAGLYYYYFESTEGRSLTTKMLVKH